jgi:hypothetical protein
MNEIMGLSMTRPVALRLLKKHGRRNIDTLSVDVANDTKAIVFHGFDIID